MFDKKKQAHDLMNSARRKMTNGDVDGAMQELGKATELYVSVYNGDDKYLSSYFMRLGDVLYNNLSRYEDAIAYYNKAIEHLKKMGDSENMAYIYYTIGEIYDVDIDKVESAIDYINKALELYQNISEQKTLQCLEKLAYLYTGIKETDLVISILEKACPMREAMSSKKSYAEALHGYGKLCFELKAHDEAMKYLDKSSKIYLELEGEESENYNIVFNEYKMVKAYKGYELV